MPRGGGGGGGGGGGVGGLAAEEYHNIVGIFRGQSSQREN